MLYVALRSQGLQLQFIRFWGTSFPKLKEVGSFAYSDRVPFWNLIRIWLSCVFPLLNPLLIGFLSVAWSFFILTIYNCTMVLNQKEKNQWILFTLLCYKQLVQKTERKKIVNLQNNVKSVQVSVKIWIFCIIFVCPKAD